ncbi:MAG: ribosomal-processing cysteine protease Prp [Spirochaetes bacterium]|nr:ribosomal-processing cysteine protease Prp [Spirochaetota bacterium]
MIEVTFFRKKKRFSGFEIKGHSHFYDKWVNKMIRAMGIRQKDYICSAVSAVAYMAVIGLKKVGKKKVKYKTGHSGFMLCCLDQDPDSKTDLLFETLRMSLVEIDKEYPGNIRIHY